MIERNDPYIREKLEAISLATRKEIVELAFHAGKNSAHVGGCLSMVEILTVLYYVFVHRNSSDMNDRDRVIMSKGHASLAHYCALESVGLITKKELSNFETNGSNYTAHARKNIEKGLEICNGSLGLGISYAVGVAEALKEKNSTNKVYVVIGDGECDEGLVWESLMFAKHRNLTNLIVIVDHNHLQADGTIEEVLNSGSLPDKFKAFGFHTQQCDGHSVEALVDAFSNATDDAPNAIIAETVKGKGISFMENKTQWHFSQLTEKKYQKAIAELNKE